MDDFVWIEARDLSVGDIVAFGPISKNSCKVGKDANLLKVISVEKVDSLCPQDKKVLVKLESEDFYYFYEFNLGCRFLVKRDLCKTRKYIPCNPNVKSYCDNESKYNAFVVGDVIRLPDYRTAGGPKEKRLWQILSIELGGCGQESCYEIKTIDRQGPFKQMLVPCIILESHPGIEKV